MSRLDLIGVVCGLVLSVGCYQIRPRLTPFVGLSVVVILVATFQSLPQLTGDGAAAAMLLILGLCVYAFGLWISRVLLQRSVSLHLLSGCVRGKVSGDAKAELRSRLEETQRFGLTILDGEEFRLTFRGRFVAKVMRVIYRLTRMET